MEWLDRMNDALRYLEDNLRGKVDHREAARIACASLRRFQRMFEFVTDMTVDEYLRRRRMALAARDLLDSGISVTELAARYGYESPDAFTRAFRADGATPETDAWNELRAWAVANLGDYAVRRYFGFAPRGHHPNGEEESAHEYCAMMPLNGDEGACGEFYGARVVDAPRGLFLAGDVVLNEYTEDGAVDIGASMTVASRTIYECMLDMGGYELDFGERVFLEEHIFGKGWFTADEHEKILPEWRFWLPVRRV